MIHFSRRGFFSPRGVFALCGLTLAALALPGCYLIQGPEKAAAPEIVEKPKQPVFDATDNLTHGVKMPGLYRVMGVTSGELLTIQGVNMVQKGRTLVAEPGVTETVRLAGIVAPEPGKPGWQNTVNKVNEWVGGATDLELEVDPKFPVDLQNHRMVQIYFTPKVKGATTGASRAGTAGAGTAGAGTVPASAPGGRWNLNRMLVHTGYAVVDLFGATSVGVDKWLNDEEFAKNYVDPKTNQIKPLGLWGLGISIQQRVIPTRGKGAIVVIPGSTSPIGSTVQGNLQSSQTTQTQQTTRTTTQNGPSSTGMPAGASATTPSATAPSATAPSATAPSTTSSTASTSPSMATRSVTTPSSAATSTAASATTRATNSVSAP